MSDVRAIPDPADNPTEAALSAGWQAFRNQPWALGGLQLPLLVLPMILVAVLAAVRSAGVSNVALGLAAGLCFAVLVALYSGYAFLALRLVRGEPAGVTPALAGLRRFPAVLVGTIGVALTGVAFIVGVAVPVALLRDLTGQPALGALLARVLPSPWLRAVSVAIADATFDSAVGLLGAAALLYVALGLAPWPLVLLDRGVGPRAALTESWALMRGRRLRLMSLALAIMALHALGVLALGFGVIVTHAVAVAAFAAFYDRLAAPAPDRPALEVGEPAASEGVSAAEPPDSATRRRRWSVPVADAFLLLYLTAILWLAVMIGSVVHIVELNKTTWAPFGPAMLLVPVLLPPLLVPLVYFVLSRRRGGTPAAWLLGPGWGRFEWLAVPWAVLVAVSVYQLLTIIPPAVTGISALGVGHEMGRQLTVDLPAGHVSAPNVRDASDWLRAMDVATDTDTVWSEYTITDTVGTPYRFQLIRYNHEQTAIAALDRLATEANARPEPGLADGSVAVMHPETGLALVAVRDGETVLAGEGPSGQIGALRTLVERQLERLPTARARVEAVHSRLPKPVQELEVEP